MSIKPTNELGNKALIPANTTKAKHSYPRFELPLKLSQAKKPQIQSGKFSPPLNHRTLEAKPATPLPMQVQQALGAYQSHDVFSAQERLRGFNTIDTFA